MNNHYLNVFIESAWVASIIPLGSEPTYFAMKAFGGYSMAPALMLAVAGAFVGYSFNWFTGYLISTLRPKGAVAQPKNWQIKGKHLFNRYGIFLLLLCWLPVMNIWLVAAGLLRTPYKIALVLATTGAAIHYSYILLT